MLIGGFYFLFIFYSLTNSGKLFPSASNVYAKISWLLAVASYLLYRCQSGIDLLTNNIAGLSCFLTLFDSDETSW